MKSVISLVVVMFILLGSSQIVSANATSINSSDWTQTVDGLAPNFEDNTADIGAYGLLGSDPNPQWINVTIPIETIFYNVKNDLAIKSPTYTIRNNSGRPVDVTVGSFEHLSTDILPNDFDLTLDLESTSTKNKTDHTSLIKTGKLETSFSQYLVTLANNQGKQTINSDPIPNSFLATYTYKGYATVTEQQKTNYRLKLKFVPVTLGYMYF